MTRASLRHTMNHRDLLGLFRSSDRRCSVKKGVLKNFTNFTGKHLCWSQFLTTLQVFRPAALLKDILTLMLTHILKNICKRLLLFVSPQSTITNTGGKCGLEETSTKCNGSIFLNATILFNQIQPFNLYVS